MLLTFFAPSILFLAFLAFILVILEGTPQWCLQGCS